MDVALRVAERVTMMHDGRVIVEGTPDEIRANELVHDLYLGQRHHDDDDVSEPLLDGRGARTRTTAARTSSRTSRSSMGEESVAVIGRNGMGKTTLCAAIMGISPPRRRGSVRFEGEELLGRPSYKIAGPGSATSRRAAGSSRRSRSTSTCSMLGARQRRRGAGRSSASTSSSRASPSGSGTAARSSRAASSRCSRSGARCSRTRSSLIMDEPSEGLAPTIIENLIETFQTLEQEGLAILLIEQNLGVATSLAERQLVMVGGEIAAETTATSSPRDAELQRRYLGVEPARALSVRRTSRSLAALAALARRGLRGLVDPKGPPDAGLRQHPGRRLRDLRR